MKRRSSSRFWRNFIVAYGYHDQRQSKVPYLLVLIFYLTGKMIYLPESQEYLGVVHIHRDYVKGAGFYGSHYTQAFLTLDSNNMSCVRRLGTEFCVRSAERANDCEAIQFVMGLDLVHNDKLVLGYGVEDLEARILTMKLDEAMATLQTYSHATLRILGPFTREKGCRIDRARP